jgi:insulysin
MNQDYAQKEVNAVHSEYEGNVVDDEWREEEIFISLANKESFMFNFGTGNKVSLQKPNIHEKLRVFYDQHYSSNLMTLVVYSSLDFSELLKYAQDSFGKIYNKDLEVPKYQHRIVPYGPQEKMKLVKYNRVDEESMLTFNFLLESYLE